MNRITIDGKPYLFPAKPEEATLGFFERIHRTIGDGLQEREIVALIVGCEVADIEACNEEQYYDILSAVAPVMQWLPKWMKDCEKAPVKPYRVGVAPKGFLNKYVYRHKSEKLYMPKNWEQHRIGSTALLDKWLNEKQATLVSDVISLYLAPSVFGQDFTEEDRLSLRDLDLLHRPAIEVVPFFTYALEKRRHSSRLWLRLLGRLIRSTSTHKN